MRKDKEEILRFEKKLKKIGNSACIFLKTVYTLPHSSSIL